MSFNSLYGVQTLSSTGEESPVMTESATLGDRPTHEPAKAGLARVLGPAGAVLLVLSCITPASSLFIIVPELLASQGSGVVLTVAVGVVISAAVGACYAELGTRMPSAGGEYAMVSHTLGRAAGWATFALSAVLLWVIPPIIALGTADYLSDLFTVDRGIAAAAVMLIATGVALLDVRANALVTGLFLGLEILAAVVVSVLGLVHVQRGPAEIFNAHVAGVDGVEPFTMAILVSGLAVGTFVVSGFNTAAYLAEDLVEPRRNVPRVVFWSLGLGAMVILVPTITTVLAVDDLDALTTGSFSDFVRNWSNGPVAVAVNLGIAVAILNAVIVMVLQNARVVYASGRDRAWPASVNLAFTQLSERFGSPWLATLLIGVPGALMAYVVPIEGLLGITSVILSLIYVVIAVAALRVRSLGAAHQGWRMPLWPLPSIVVIAAVGYALTGSPRSDLLITAAIAAASLVYYFGYLARRPADRFVVIDPSAEPAVEPSAQSASV
jgi:amino acid transporter